MVIGRIPAHRFGTFAGGAIAVTSLPADHLQQVLGIARTLYLDL
jgi:hypothetical protein